MLSLALVVLFFSSLTGATVLGCNRICSNIADLPAEMLNTILEFDERNSNRLGRCNKYLDAYTSERWRLSHLVAGSFNLASLKCVPPHEDFCLLRDFYFPPTIKGFLYATRTLSLAIYGPFEELPYKALLVKAFANEFLKLMRKTREAFERAFSKIWSYRHYQICTALIELAVNHGTAEEALYIYNLFIRLSLNLPSHLKLLSGSKRVLEYCVTNGDYFAVIYPKFDRELLVHLLSRDFSPAEINQIITARSVSAAQVAQVLIELCSNVESKFLQAPPVSDTIRQLYEGLAESEETPILLTCLRLRGIVNISEEEHPLPVIDGTRNAAIMANRFDYLEVGITNRIFKKRPDMERVHFKNAQFISFLRQHLSVNESNFCDFIFDNLTMDCFNGDFLAFYKSEPSLMELITTGKYSVLAERVWPVLNQEGPMDRPEAIIALVRRAKIHLIRELLNIGLLNWTNVDHPSFIPIAQALLERIETRQACFKWQLDSATFMKLFSNDQIRNQMLNLKRAGKIDPQMALDDRQLLSKEAYFKVLEEHKSEALELTGWSNLSEKYLLCRLSPSELTRLLKLRQEHVSVFIWSLLSKDSVLQYYRRGLAIHYLPLAMYAFLWFHSQRDGFYATVNYDQRPIDEILSPSDSQENHILATLPFMTPERQEVTRLIMSYFCGFQGNPVQQQAIQPAPQFPPNPQETDDEESEDEWGPIEFLNDDGEIVNGDGVIDEAINDEDLNNQGEDEAFNNEGDGEGEHQDIQG